MKEHDNDSVLDPLILVNREFIIRERGTWIEACSGEEVEHLKSAAAQKHLINLLRRKVRTLQQDVHSLCEDDGGLKRWRLHTRLTHPLHVAPKLLKESYNCLVTNQAFCKFLEILSKYPRLIQPTDNQFRTFHLCEAPGYFIQALDRFLCTYHPNLQWYWEANSLNPYCEHLQACDMILDDDLMYAHPARWRFGSDGTGDVTKWEGPYFRTIVGVGFDLVTADGSLYTQDRPDEQEEIVASLLQAEVNAALRLLRQNGSFILKLYNMFLPATRRLVADIASRFYNVSIFKPMCSKSGNAERYLICMGFMKKELGNNVQVGTCLVKCEEYFTLLQCDAIRTNIETFSSSTSNFQNKLNSYRDRLIGLFLKNILAVYIANPFRESWLRCNGGNPWKDMFGDNYIERLKVLSTPEKARQYMSDQLRLELLSGGVGELIAESDMIDVEWSSEELDFIHSVEADLPLEKAEANRFVVYGPKMPLKHSIFTLPTYLHATLQFAPSCSIDLCVPSGTEHSSYAKRVCDLIQRRKNMQITIEANRMTSKKDWLFVLRRLAENVMAVEELTIVWGDASYPLILSRFSASVISFLTIIFSKFHLKQGVNLAYFSHPNYPEDMPKGIVTFLKECVNRSTLLLQFVPINILAAMYTEIFGFNKRQWRLIMINLADQF
ncbi:unnamed protein product [Auanema sp. JU1783]|nr:unnamed protein product [Auanema sp. JU1783]